ncbi:hydantoinase/oxoprolinase N-terminal domain-containing protein [Neobacillus sp. OS1-33]|uniref:hydantoinase/oxoprolinase N-terminal domain-containing protein n=1 Tax=Neobacillus sp. OS1-33 TaxID=3070683 RepID=UPI0027E06363|nr:hydantoinase/oxoprolinase N-terminal domain-containing protein [Neobacillus sp. OS1-33]WML26343.1 hydantoinase/oxoprolinase N-terminal domain-containing protein [Neobacillus sp. OS1-33]
MNLTKKELETEVRVGIDTGGTFTDCVLWRTGEEPIVVKVPSTPSNPAEAIINGLELLCLQAGIPFTAVHFLVHGTTVATNAMLQEQWGKVGLITTKGFRDSLEIGTQMRPELYQLHQRKLPPIVPRNLILPIIGLLIIGYVWYRLESIAKIFGFSWVVIGIVYMLIINAKNKKIPNELNKGHDSNM